MFLNDLDLTWAIFRSYRTSKVMPASFIDEVNELNTGMSIQSHWNQYILVTFDGSICMNKAESTFWEAQFWYTERFVIQLRPNSLTIKSSLATVRPTVQNVGSSEFEHVIVKSPFKYLTPVTWRTGVFF